MTRIEAYSFQHLIKLKRLDLGGNEIEQIDSNGFQSLENLEGLFIDFNKIFSIKSFEHLNKLEELDLQYN